MSGRAVAALAHVRGETITFGLRATPDYDGTEIVACDIKAAVNGFRVPADGSHVVTSAAVQFVASSGDNQAHWLFSIPASTSAGLSAGNYITDAKVTYASGAVDYPQPLAIQLADRVTA